MNIRGKREMCLGIAFCAVFAGLAMWIEKLEFCVNYKINSLIIAIAIGVLIGNIFTKGLSESMGSGISFCSKKILRLAIILYGFRITFAQIYAVGLSGLIADVVMLTSTFFLGYFLGTRLFKLDRDLTILTSIGSSICGAAAVLGTDGLLKAQAHKVSLAVATVVLFGSLSMLLYPFIYQLGFLSDSEFGIYIGASVHEVAQVVAAGGAINPEVMDTAVIVKLTRVMMLVVFLLFLSLYLSKEARKSGEEQGKLQIPYFAFLFVAMCGINSLNIIPTQIVASIVEFDIFLLTMAMFALGLDTNLQKIKNLGIKPILLALIMFIWLIVVGLVVAKIV